MSGRQRECRGRHQHRWCDEQGRRQVGDSPIVGAGVFADNRTLAVAATGTGEVFIRGTAASTISDMMEFGKVPMAEAARRVVVDRLKPLGGTGGVIALSPSGELAAPHTTAGLVYGFADGSGKVTTRVFHDEDPQDR